VIAVLMRLLLLILLHDELKLISGLVFGKLKAREACEEESVRTLLLDGQASRSSSPF
jgi:hypothetical protein